MRKFDIRPGDRFGRLVVLEGSTVDSSGHTVLKCRCDCGKVVYARGDALYNGKRVSCGCGRVEKMMETKRLRRLGIEPVAPPVEITPVDKDKFDDWWMFGGAQEIKRLRKMFQL